MNTARVFTNSAPTNSSPAHGRIRASLPAQGPPIVLLETLPAPHVLLETLLAPHVLLLGCVLVTSNQRESSRVPGLATGSWVS